MTAGGVRAWLEQAWKGVGSENPLVRLVIGLCPTLAVSTSLEGSFFIGLAVLFVLTMANIIVSAFRHLIPEQVRIPIFIVIIASFVTIVDLAMKAYLPGVYRILGIWIPLIVVNCIILGRAEGFAYRNPVGISVADAVGKGIGFTLMISILAFVREFFGSGEIVFLGDRLLAMPDGYVGPSLLILFPGAFLVVGFMIAAINAVDARSRQGKEAGA